jgi:hypothetical protein
MVAIHPLRGWMCQRQSSPAGAVKVVCFVVMPDMSRQHAG